MFAVCVLPLLMRTCYYFVVAQDSPGAGRNLRRGLAPQHLPCQEVSACERTLAVGSTSQCSTHGLTPPPLGALRNVRKTSDDFGDVLMMNDESLASSCHKMAASDHTSMPAPLTLQQRTKSDTAAASSLSSSWCRPLLGEDVFMSNSDKEVDSEAPLKRNGSQGMLRARSTA